MKKTTLLLLVILLITMSCSEKKQIDYVIFSGEIQNPSSDSINIINSQLASIHTIKLSENNTFKDTIFTQGGFYTLDHGPQYSHIYLKPRFDLNLFLNTRKFDKSIIYKGVGSIENNYLAKKILLQQSFGKLGSPYSYAKLSEPEFLRLTDSLYKVKINFLNENKEGLEKDFIIKESKSLEFEKLFKIADFESWVRFVTENKDFKVSDNFPDPYYNIDFSDEKLLIYSNYLKLLQSYIGKKVKERRMKDKNRDYYLMFLKAVEGEIMNLKIKEALVYKYGKQNLSHTQELDSVFNLIKSHISNEKYIDEIQGIYDELKKIKKGVVSPIFDLYDINEKLISLKDLKGKLVYIDLWATWCVPCIKEIPYLKKLEEEFKGEEIQFVSISIWDNKEKWKTMVLEKKLGGIQLFAPDRNISFIKDYLVKGIPRFILIDREGKVINGDAKRPSNPELKEELLKLL